MPTKTRPKPPPQINAPGSLESIRIVRGWAVAERRRRAERERERARQQILALKKR